MSKTYNPRRGTLGGVFRYKFSGLVPLLAYVHRPILLIPLQIILTEFQSLLAGRPFADFKSSTNICRFFILGLPFRFFLVNLGPIEDPVKNNLLCEITVEFGLDNKIKLGYCTSQNAKTCN